MKKNRPKKYEESLKNCILLARIEFFTISADPEDEYQCQLAEKIFQTQRKIEKKQKDNGLSGGANSSLLRGRLLKKLEFPEHMSPNAMLQALNLLYNLEELTGIVSDLEKNDG